MPTFVWSNWNSRNTCRSQYHLASCVRRMLHSKITSCIFCVNDSLCFMAAREPSAIYQMKCVFCRFVTFYMTHVVVFSSLSSLCFSFWNCTKCIYNAFYLVSNNSYKIHEFLFCMSPVGSLLSDCGNPQEQRGYKN